MQQQTAIHPVMAGLVPAIHALLRSVSQTPMRAGMTGNNGAPVTRYADVSMSSRRLVMM